MVTPRLVEKHPMSPRVAAKTRPTIVFTVPNLATSVAAAVEVHVPDRNKRNSDPVVASLK